MNVPIDIADLQAQRRQNRFQSALLVIGMAVIMATIGHILVGRTGMFVALGLCLASAIVGPRISPQVVLRMFQAQRVDPRQSPDLYEVITELARRAELPQVPVLYYIPTRMLNAFAVGSEKNSAIAMTDGLIRTLNPRELIGVMAHEVAHIRHHDMRVMGLADVVARITGSLSQLGQFMLLLQLPAVLMGATIGVSFLQILVLIFAPLATNLLQLALSRAREFHADLGAVDLTGDPHGLASALAKLETAHGGNWLEKLLMPHRRAPEPAILRTHPPTEERLKRLQDLVARAPRPASPLWKDDTESAACLCDRCQSAPRRAPRPRMGGLWY